MTDLKRINLFYMLHAYKENYSEIHSSVNKSERFKDGPAKNILGMAVGTFLVVLILEIVIFIWTVWALIKFWNQLSWVSRIACLFFLFSGFGINVRATNL